MNKIVSIADFYADCIAKIRVVKEAVANVHDAEIYGSSDVALHCVICRRPLRLCHGPRTGYFLIHPHNDHCPNQFARFIHSRDRNEALQGANLTEVRRAENGRLPRSEPGRGSGIPAHLPAGLAQPLPREHAPAG